MSLDERRAAMRHLLDEKRHADSRASYYAFHHPTNRTTLVTWQPDTIRATGYLCFSRTGLDLFRPIISMRLPEQVHDAIALLDHALPTGASILMSVPDKDMPVIRARFDIQTSSETAFMALDRGRFQPIINVLVTSNRDPNGQPRFHIRNQGEIAASAGVNWQSPRFAEVSVNTNPQYRRNGYGRSVLAGLSQHLIENGRTPMYVVSTENRASIDLARSVGFIDTGYREHFLEATKR